jgi:hypothetical protein
LLLGFLLLLGLLLLADLLLADLLLAELGLDGSNSTRSRSASFFDPLSQATTSTTRITPRMVCDGRTHRGAAARATGR